MTTIKNILNAAVQTANLMAAVANTHGQDYQTDSPAYRAFQRMKRAHNEEAAVLQAHIHGEKYTGRQ